MVVVKAILSTTKFKELVLTSSLKNWPLGLGEYCESLYNVFVFLLKICVQQLKWQQKASFICEDSRNVYVAHPALAGHDDLWNGDI